MQQSQPKSCQISMLIQKKKLKHYKFVLKRNNYYEGRNDGRVEWRTTQIQLSPPFPNAGYKYWQLTSYKNGDTFVL